MMVIGVDGHKRTHTLVAEIREIHAGHKGTYGVRRVHAELRGFGRTVNRKRVERLMRINGIEGRHLRRRKRTTVRFGV
ncbi:IS3 family transposase [Streptomyces sp. NPDC059070]|uniref:IS3 family transposase n=1 Tax=Streptomyces sp. NPDC059070 TaxID=3346713 RepID=UPI003691366A